MYQIRDNTYRLQNSDIKNNKLGYYIEIEDYINCSILFQNTLYKATVYYYNSSYELSPPEGFKHIYLSEVNDNFNVNDYCLIINTIKTLSKTESLDKNIHPETNESLLQINSSYTTLLAGLMFQCNQLSTTNINIRKQEATQDTVVTLPQDQTYNLIKIADFEIYDKESNSLKKAFVPYYNQDLQKIYISLFSNELIKNPPIAFHLQMLNYNDDILFQLKTNVNDNTAENYKYLINYGYQYGVLQEVINNKKVISGRVWSNAFHYNSNKYIVEWYLSEQQMNILRNEFNYNQKPFKFRCCYSSTKNNKKFVWNGWSILIDDIYLNNPPSTPSELKIKEL